MQPNRPIKRFFSFKNQLNYAGSANVNIYLHKSSSALKYNCGFRNYTSNNYRLFNDKYNENHIPVVNSSSFNIRAIRPLMSSISCNFYECGFHSKCKSLISVKEILTKCKNQLKEDDIDEASLHAEYIVAHSLKCSRTEMKSVLNKTISEEELNSIEKMINCRLGRMPLQYILGEWEFHSIPLKVRPPVFIPRPETEGLVNLCLEFLKDIDQPLVADVCCGSGAISLALLNHFPQLQCVAIDQSKYAADLTRENADDLEVRDRLQVVQWKITSDSFPSLPSSQFDLVVSNPPYVLRKDLQKLQPEISLYEDLRALDGGKYGLDIIEQIILHGQHFLKNNGCLFMEIDPCHRYLLPTWMEERKTTLTICNFFNDHRGVDRYVKLVKN